ncbi:uncharacterized protein LOC100378181 [Saccoglossus kowalevskii]
METGRILECCLDEIALEGLVGINIASLWIRLDQRLSELPISVNIDNVMKGFLWQCITNSGDVKYYELDKPPPPIDPCLKFRQRDPEQGLEVVGEMTTGNSSEHIINDIVKGVKGVCTDYTTRKDVTQDIRENFIKLSDAVDRFGDRLVVVASQNLRNIALLGNQNDPEIEISDLHYAILECLGKSRYYGMLQTQIYTEFNFAAKNMFYQRKKLFRVIGCVTSQSYAVRLPGGRLQHSVLLMLKRFHVDYRSKYDVLSEKLSNLLKTKPDQMDVAVNVKCEMGLEYEASAFKKLLKYAFGLNFVKMVNVTKKVETAPDKSRTQTTKYLKLLKDYNSKDEAIVDDEEEETEFSTNALPERVAQIHELPLLNQVYNIVEQHGSNGISLRTLQRMMNLGKVEIRQIGKNLLRTGTVACIPHDEGRQRTYRYVTVRNIASSQIQKDLDKAKKKSMILEMQKKGTSSVNDETGSLDLGDGSVHSTPCSTPSISPLPSAGNSRTNTPEPVEDNAAREMSDPGRSKGKMPLTTRVLKRRNIIIETVRTCRVVQGVFSLLKAVLSVEKDEGISYRCDKKSIVRLVKVLVQEGLIRQFTTIVASDDGSARNKVDFITDINIQPNDELVKSAIAQVKFRMENVIRHKQEKAEKRKQPSKAIKVTISSPKKSKKRKSDSSNDDDEREVSKTCKESPSTGKLSSVGSNGDEDKKTEEGAVRLERLKGTPKLLKDIMKVKGNYFDPQVCAEEYVALVASMKEKFSSLPANLKFDLPETIDELYKQYKLLPVGQQINFDDKVVVRTRRDIVKAQLTNLIQISLLMDSSKYNSYQVFKIYEQYSTDLLESAFNTLRNRGLVNRKRAISGCKTTRHVPFAAMSYQLSAAYQRYFLSLMPASLFLEVKTFLQKLAKSTSDPKERWVEFPNEACGGIVCTMATLMTMKKMFFDVTVPEQIVVVDSDLMENKVLSSSKQTLSNVSSDSDDDDDDDDDDVIAPVPILPSPVKTHKSTEVVNTTTVQSQSISKDNLQEPIASTSGMQPAPLLSTSSVNSGPKPAPVASTSSVNSGTQPAPVASTSTVNSGTQSTSLPSTSTVNSQNPAFDVTPRQASRSNLLLYRGHYAPGIVSKRNLNPQDNIVVNACTILVTLTSGNDGVHTCIKCENKEQEQCLVDESEESLDCVKQLMCKSLSDMCNNSIVPSEKPQLDDVVNTCKDQGYSEPVLKMLVEIYNVIESKKEFGIATRDMYQHSVISRYGMSREIVETVIKLLQDKSLIIEAGISVPTLVSVHHASPWMIHSLKLKDNSSIPSDPIHPIQSKSDPVDAPTDTPRKGRSKEKETTSVETPTSFEEGVFEPVEFLSHPWHTVEGTANETSLASMLNGLMMTIMNSPGLSEKSLLHRYQGVLYPVSVKHLFKMLIDMGCITRLARVKRKCSLFSSPWQATPDIGAEEDIYYEPTVDGVLRLAAALHQ